MYGQFHNEQSLRTTKLSLTKSFSEKKTGSKKSLFFISLLLAVFVVSTASFAGGSQPRLKGGNGNAQGR
jgi:hypothetical protein